MDHKWIERDPTSYIYNSPQGIDIISIITLNNDYMWTAYIDNNGRTVYVDFFLGSFAEAKLATEWRIEKLVAKSA